MRLADPLGHHRLGRPRRQAVHALGLDDVGRRFLRPHLVVNRGLDVDQIVVAGQQLAGRHRGVAAFLVADDHAPQLVHGHAVHAVHAPRQSEVQARFRPLRQHPAEAPHHGHLAGQHLIQARRGVAQHKERGQSQQHEDGSPFHFTSPLAVGTVGTAGRGGVGAPGLGGLNSVSNSSRCVDSSSILLLSPRMRW